MIPGLIIYYLLLNGGLFFLMGWDKRQARRGGWRVPESRLWLCAVLGGGLGGLLAQRCWHHKTQKPAFALIFTLSLILHLLLLILWWRLGS